MWLQVHLINVFDKFITYIYIAIQHDIHMDETHIHDTHVLDTITWQIYNDTHDTHA